MYRSATTHGENTTVEISAWTWWRDHGYFRRDIFGGSVLRYTQYDRPS